MHRSIFGKIWSTLLTFKQDVHFYGSDSSEDSFLLQLIHYPLPHLLLGSLSCALLMVTLNAMLAATNAYFLQASRHPLRWLRVLVLPAAIPLVFYLLLLSGLLHHTVGELELTLRPLLPALPSGIDLIFLIIASVSCY